MVTSMLVMPRRATKGQQVHPEGGLISLTSEQRSEVKRERLGLGMRQEDLAKKVGTSVATISNMEGGRSKQVKRGVYANVLRALKIAKGAVADASTTATDEAYGKLIDGLSGLDGYDIETVTAFVERLRDKNKGR